MKTTNVLLSMICALLALIVFKMYQPQQQFGIAGNPVPVTQVGSLQQTKPTPVPVYIVASAEDEDLVFD
jgi:hypothetical protein